MKKIVTIPPGRVAVQVILNRFYKLNSHGDPCAASGLLQVYLIGPYRKKILRRQLQGKVGTPETAGAYCMWTQIVNGKGVVLEVDVSRVVDSTCEFDVELEVLNSADR